MKQKTLIICLIFLSKISFSQNLDTLLSGYKEFDPYDFFSVYSSDVYSYFEPDYDYSTPLKKITFEKTPEYKKLSDSLKNIKKALLKPTYLNISAKNDVEYDLKKGGIKILMSSRFNRREVKGIINVYEPDPSADSKKYLYFSNLALIPDMVYPQRPDLAQREEYIFIPLSKEKGLVFEDANSAELYILFMPTNISKTVQVEHAAYRYEMYDCKYVNAIAKKIVLVADGKIIYSRSL